MRWPRRRRRSTDAGWKPTAYEDQIRTGVLIGSGIGGLQGIEKTSLLFAEKGPRRVSPFFIPGRLINLASGYVSIEHGLKGPNHAVVTACSTGAHAIGDASRLDRARRCRCDGRRRHRVAGLPAGDRRLRRLPGAVDQFQRPAASRPRAPMTATATASSWARARASWCSRSSSTPRRAARKIYAEIIGYGLSGDAYHITAPAEDGDGAYRCMTAAVKRAGIEPADIDYINAHGTSTPMGDEIELAAVERLFGNAAGKVSMSSTKSAIGHLLGAAGAVEAIFSVLAIRDNIAPPTLNLDNPSVATAIDLVPHQGADAARSTRCCRIRSASAAPMPR